MLQMNSHDICANLLRRKYLGRKAFLQVANNGGSLFWKGVIRTREILKWGCQVRVNSGSLTRFWGAHASETGVPFPISDLCISKLLGKGMLGWGWSVKFRTPLGQADMLEWERMVEVLDGEKDCFCWVLDKTGVYSSRSMYRRLTFRGVTNKRMQRPWKSKLLQKLKVFTWLAFQDRLQTGLNLKKKKVEGVTEPTNL